MSSYNNYLNNFSKCWEAEKSNESPLKTLEAMYKLYLFKQVASDTSLKASEVNKFFIREVFKISGDIKKSPFKSCIYNKLTCLHYLIEKTSFSLSQKIDVDKFIEDYTNKQFKNISNFYDVMKLANAKKQKAKKQKDSTSGINEEASNEKASNEEASKVVNITNTTEAKQEAIIDSMQLLDELMKTTLNHFEVCFVDSPKTSLKKLIAFSESINQTINKASKKAKSQKAS